MNEIKAISLDNFESIKHIDENGVEFWYARELMGVLNYTKWGNFIRVIEKAMMSVQSTNIEVSYHFADVGKTIEMPKNATKTIVDYKLTRYACYLIVQNGDPRKKEIALGQQYFAVQTRKQEILEENLENLSEDERRLFFRKQTKEHNKRLFKTAHEYSNVNNYGKFNNSGYQGLYGGETASSIKKRKKIKEKEEILDYMNPTELAANFFRITQTDERLKKGDIKTEDEACKKHFEIGKTVRNTMKEISGVLPEDLPTPDKSIKDLEKEKKKKLRLENETKKLSKK